MLAIKHMFSPLQTDYSGLEKEYHPDAVTCIFLLALYQYLPFGTALHFDQYSIKFQIPDEVWVPQPFTRWKNGDSRLDTLKILLIVQKALQVIPPKPLVFAENQENSVQPTPIDEGEKEAEKEFTIPDTLNKADFTKEYSSDDPITNIWLHNLLSIRCLQLHYGYKPGPLPSAKIKTDPYIFTEQAKSEWIIENQRNVSREEDRRASAYLHQAYLLIMEALMKEEGTSLTKTTLSTLQVEFIEEYKKTLSFQTTAKISKWLNKLKEKNPESSPKKYECKEQIKKYRDFCYNKRVPKFINLVSSRSYF